MAGSTPPLKQRVLVYAILAAAGLGIWLKVRAPAAANASPAGQGAVAAALPASAPAPLPTELKRPMLQPADWNPFAGWTPPPPPPPPAPKVAPAPPAPPSPPPLNLTFVGRMTAPDGKEAVFAMQDGNSVQLNVGQTLPNGYVVKAISPRAVELHYPPLNSTARLDLPEPPRHETR